MQDSVTEPCVNGLPTMSAEPITTKNLFGMQIRDVTREFFDGCKGKDFFGTTVETHLKSRFGCGGLKRVCREGDLR